MPKYPEFDWNTKNIAEDFPLFKQHMELCLEDNEVTDEEKQARKIKIALGKKGLKKINNSTLTS